ncbi:multifunctional expression regulator [Testudinid alphaherpesvirus 3]|uniref:Multifunctional expression regulator n=1 Tax=Testudinid alphaherpesvirus 3 TaxID=2560801 RepID=A0A0K1R1Z1_9ALPH|nr:multifunctional expression regulator [Testudinid alphaherpesvirus 3]AIU39247.1 multifunctional expression regulator [Testudinid alphaherpesvirus 3]AIU39357.1 multifunctional expression regulator [Testudinid alphaherpesvirus 3]AKI81633.1 multifunctional expression regulator [Testudinid alphaherpesvirus 3]AKI81737.1 multifunctional expression regulator [Testudinid alphaherpesvirus 3]AKV40716.1 UL54 multifunctional protein [Testudinid alphaherpesvirus 3]
MTAAARSFVEYDIDLDMDYEDDCCESFPTTEPMVQSQVIKPRSPSQNSTPEPSYDKSPNTTRYHSTRKTNRVVNHRRQIRGRRCRSGERTRRSGQEENLPSYRIRGRSTVRQRVVKETDLPIYRPFRAFDRNRSIRRRSPKPTVYRHFLNSPNDSLVRKFKLNTGKFDFEKTCAGLFADTVSTAADVPFTRDTTWRPRMFNCQQLAYQISVSNPISYTMDWETLLLQAEGLKRAFSCSKNGKEEQCAIRKQMIMNESLANLLASVDETVTWLCVHRHHGWEVHPTDPIMATLPLLTRMVKMKLRPIADCHLESVGLTTEELFDSQPRIKAQVKNPLSFMIYSLNSLSMAIESLHRKGVESVDLKEVDRYLYITAHYVPGLFTTGILEAVINHRCSDPDRERLCKLSTNMTFFPMYIGGRYFFCNAFSK